MPAAAKWQFDNSTIIGLHFYEFQVLGVTLRSLAKIYKRFIFGIIAIDIFKLV
jgi:hypothetical protein